MTSQLKSREEVQSVATELRSLSPGVVGGVVRMRQYCYEEGKVAKKYKLLTAMAISVAIRCEPCIRAYVEWAAKEGATKEELVEFLNVAITMQGCPGEEWAIKALKAYHELVDGNTANTQESCCSVPA